MQLKMWPQKRGSRHILKINRTQTSSITYFMPYWIVHTENNYNSWYRYTTNASIYLFLTFIWNFKKRPYSKTETWHWPVASYLIRFKLFVCVCALIRPLHRWSSLFWPFSMVMISEYCTHGMEKSVVIYHFGVKILFSDSNNQELMLCQG